MNESKKVLMINYYFPPVGGAGVKRMVKFVKYLTPLNWDPVVLTVKNPNHTLKDSTLEREFDSKVKVIRSYTMETLFKKSVANSNKEAVYIHSEKLFVKNKYKKHIREAYKYIGQYLKIPDSRILWLPAAFISGIISKFKDNYKIIYATGPTFTNMLVGVLLKLFTRTPLVTDFRDAWVSDPMMNHKNATLCKINAFLEKITILMSDRVISTNPHVTDDFRNRYPGQDGSKFITIYNGYDPDDFDSTEHEISGENNKYNIVHTGRLYGERTPKYFLLSLKSLLDEYPELREIISVYFVGSCESFMDDHTIEDYLDEYNLKDVVKLPGQVTREESLKYQAFADLLLLIIGIVPESMAYTYGISGKIFDYFTTGKEVLTLSDKGSTRSFLEENGASNIFGHNQIEDVGKFLKKEIDSWRVDSADNGTKNNIFADYQLSQITTQLTMSFEQLLSRRDRYA